MTERTETPERTERETGWDALYLSAVSVLSVLSVHQNTHGV
jgi:hypothetical protein